MKFANCPANKYKVANAIANKSRVGITPMNTYVTINRLRSRHRILFFSQRNARMLKNKIAMKLRKLTHPLRP